MPREHFPRSILVASSSVTFDTPDFLGTCNEDAREKFLGFTDHVISAIRHAVDVYASSPLSEGRHTDVLL